MFGWGAPAAESTGHMGSYAMGAKALENVSLPLRPARTTTQHRTCPRSWHMHLLSCAHPLHTFPVKNAAQIILATDSYKVSHYRQCTSPPPLRLPCLARALAHLPRTIEHHWSCSSFHSPAA